jgi:hypothetical protein
MTANEFKEMPNIEKIRVLSGMIPMSGDHERDVNHLVGVMGLICLISRVEMGDASASFLSKQIDKAFGVKDDIETDGQTEGSSDPE